MTRENIGASRRQPTIREVGTFDAHAEMTAVAAPTRCDCQLMQWSASFPGVCDMRKLLAAVFGILLAAAPVGAQDKPVDVNFGFGWTFPQGEFADSFDSGWNGNFGVT